MKYTAQGESQAANIARGKAECYIYHKTVSQDFITRLYLSLYHKILSQDYIYQELYTFIQMKWLCFKCFIVFYI